TPRHPRIRRSPAPLGIDCPERDMREDNNRRAGSEILHIGFEPFKLIVSELSETAGLEIQDVDQSNEMDTVFVKAVPTRAFRLDSFQVTVTVKLSAIIEHIVLPWDIENVLNSTTLEHLIKRVELFFLGRLGA